MSPCSWEKTGKRARGPPIILAGASEEVRSGSGRGEGLQATRGALAFVLSEKGGSLQGFERHVMT